MNKKQIIIMALISMITAVTLFVYGFATTKYNEASLLYQVYLNGKKIGIIENKDKLYSMINEEQKEIKDKYNVVNVYPPNNLKLSKLYTYRGQVSNVDTIYQKIELEDDFTIKGFAITIKKDDKEPIIINVLDKKIFNDAIKSFILAFLSEEQYNNYLNNEQKEIIDVGNMIENMYFEEKITVKEMYISVNDKIFTNSNELSQYLLFGDNFEKKVYEVKTGDTIVSIAENNQLNSQEFLIANPKYDSEESLLALGEEVNVSLINPMITLVYQLYSVEDVEQYFEKNVVYDKSKPSSYSKITQTGVNGITRVTSRYAVINGEQSQGIVKLSEEVIREKIDQVTTKGQRYSGGGSYINIDGDWGWPTNSGYIITSPYGWRWGSFHEGIDIALGYGSGSPIYSVAAGTVVDVTYQSKGGKMIIIDHGNNIYTMYAHLSAQLVSEGQTVNRGDVIGKMGSTGYVTGPHLHFSVSVGMPYTGSYKFISPLSLYK